MEKWVNFVAITDDGDVDDADVCPKSLLLSG